MYSEFSDHGHDKTKTFMRLVFANERRIYAYIYVLIPVRTEAEDIFQETLTVMWNKFHTFQEGKDFGAWGIGIAYNLVRNYRRKKARTRLYLEEDIENLLEQEARQSIKCLDSRIEALRTCLSHLNPLDRKILQLRYEEDVSVKTIAKKVNHTTKVIYTKLARANDLLLRCIRRTLAEQGG